MIVKGFINMPSAVASFVMNASLPVLDARLQPGQMDTFTLAEPEIFSGPFRGLEKHIFHRTDGGVARAVSLPAENLGGAEAFLEDIVIVTAYLNTGQTGDYAKHIAAAGRIAKRLEAIAGEGGVGPIYQRALDENYSYKRFSELDRVVKYVNLIAGGRVIVKSGEDRNIRVVKRVGNYNNTLKEAYKHFRSAVPAEFRGTQLLSDILGEIQEYADVVGSYVLIIEREVNRVNFYAALFLEMADVFDLFEVPPESRMRQAVEIVGQFNELRKKRQVSIRSIRHVWEMALRLNSEISINKTKTLLKRFYALSDEEFEAIMSQIPNRYLDIIYPFLLARLDLWSIPVHFKEAVASLGAKLSSAESAFNEAAELLQVKKTNELLEAFAVKAAGTAQYGGSGRRDKKDIMEMLSWRHVISFADLKRYDWEILRKCFSGSFGITGERVDELFDNVEEDVYRSHLARYALLAAESYKSPSRVKMMVIDRGVERLNDAVKRTENVLEWLPGGRNIGHAQMVSAATRALVKLKDIDYDEREAVRAVRPLIGDTTLFDAFSSSAVAAIKEMGIDLYFGSFYPQVFGLPQPLIEANVNYLAISKAIYDVKFEIHRRRAHYFRELLKVIDDHLSGKELNDAEQMKADCINWIANEATDRKQIFVDVMKEQVKAWLDRRILSGDTAWADTGWQAAVPVIGRFHTTRARLVLAESAPKRFSHPAISEAIARYVTAYVLAAPAGARRNALVGRFFGRLGFYLNALKEINEAVELIGLADEDAVLFAVDILSKIEESVKNMEAKSKTTSRRMVWHEMAKIYFSHESLRMKKKIAERFFGIENLDEFLSEAAGSDTAVLDGFLTERLQKLSASDTPAGFIKKLGKIKR